MKVAKFDLTLSQGLTSKSLLWNLDGSGIFMIVRPCFQTEYLRTFWEHLLGRKKKRKNYTLIITGNQCPNVFGTHIHTYHAFRHSCIKLYRHFFGSIPWRFYYECKD